MALIETESLVLKSYNLAEADKIVVMMTQDHGMIRGVAKGAKRLRSKFGSGLEPFSVVRVTYFEKESVELVSIQKIDLITSYFAAASNPEFLSKFSYLADLLVTFSPPHDPNETLYRMAKKCIEAAADMPLSIAAVAIYFEIWLLRLSGLLPDWSRCSGCGREFNPAESANLISNFHLTCDTCRRSTGSTVVIGLDREIWAAARRLSPEAFAGFTAQKTESVELISKILRRIIAHSIGRESVGEMVFASKV